METRQPRLERAEEAVQSIIAAATNELLEEGLDSVTHRRVAERANANLRSTTYYFKSVKALRREALKLAFSIDHNKREKALANLEQRLDKTLAEQILLFTYGPNRTVKNLAVTQQNVLTAALDEEYADVIRQLQADVESYVARLLQLYENRKEARKVVLYLDGLIFEHVISGGTTDIEGMLREYLETA